jgi:AcrR family transcriptional regulator
VPSTSANSPRRKPQQARASLRRAKFLDVAATLIGTSGFDAVTMTSIAEHAQASIGTLYDYFPDKHTLAQALAAQYAEQADEYWKQLLDIPLTIKKSDLADLLVEGALAFARDRPAYLPLFGAPFIHSRSAAARHPLRKTFANAIRKLHPQMTAPQAYISAQIIVELIKALLTVCKQVDPQERSTVTTEFKKLMRFYLSKIAH